MTGKLFDVREAIIADIPAMHRVRLAVTENVLSDSKAITETSYLPFLNDSGAWVAEVKSRIVGFAILDRSDASVWALFVDPSWEGQSIGKALHVRMIDWAARQHIERLSLTTAVDSRAARFYRALGWSEAGVTSTNELRFERMIEPTQTPA